MRLPLLTALVAILASSAAAEPVVDVALVLAADVSLSMDKGELELQREGYADALSSQIVLDAIRQGHHQRIAVTYFEWGSADKQVVVAPWTVIDGAEAAQRLSDTLRKAPTNELQRTAIGSALAFSKALLAAAPGSERQVVDISSDGTNNQGVPVTLARAELLATGATINGLPLMPKPGDWPASQPPLDQYFEECVIGGPGSFSFPAASIETFSTALKTKLVLEIAGIPQTEPRVMRAAYDPVQCVDFD